MPPLTSNSYLQMLLKRIINNYILKAVRKYLFLFLISHTLLVTAKSFVFSGFNKESFFT
ncbi:MAG: hypothetical protein BWZ06_01085 [Bacteroidetes bacterium ADurb.BinA261]|jgi:hypothetical protein|nr:MAG: hypothetical protein BWZ06_01085 [Bacteroidetes bacterium ADurb.BinA261]